MNTSMRASAALALLVMVAGGAQAESLEVSRPGYTLQAEWHGNGAVAVVFEAGFGQDQKAWRDVIDALGEDCRCIAYARAGLGRSGSDGTPKSLDQHVEDLAAVIDAAAPDAKVVLVGHSYGGLIATEFARVRPQRLHGLVLVDPTTMGQRHALRELDGERVQADDRMLLSMLPPAMAEDYRSLVSRLDSDAAARAPGQWDVPVALLTSTRVADEPFVLEETARGKQVWRQQHAALFAGFSKGSHEYLDNGHNIHQEAPNAVASAVRRMISEATTGSLPN